MTGEPCILSLTLCSVSAGTSACAAAVIVEFRAGRLNELTVLLWRRSRCAIPAERVSGAGGLARFARLHEVEKTNGREGKKKTRGEKSNQPVEFPVRPSPACGAARRACG